jgi:hypothetical protein
VDDTALYAGLSISCISPERTSFKRHRAAPVVSITSSRYRISLLSTALSDIPPRICFSHDVPASPTTFRTLHLGFPSDKAHTLTISPSSQQLLLSLPTTRQNRHLTSRASFKHRPCLPPRKPIAPTAHPPCGTAKCAPTTPTPTSPAGTPTPGGRCAHGPGRPTAQNTYTRSDARGAPGVRVMARAQVGARSV